MKTARMLQLEEWFSLTTQPVILFLSLVCITGVTPIGHRNQPRTVFQLYDLFVRTVKLLYRHLAVSLNFDLDDDGGKKTDHQLFLEVKVPTLKDFCKQVDELVGSAHYENRTAKGFGYPNLVVKDILVYWLYSSEVRANFKGFDSLIEALDRIETMEDSIASVEGFAPLAESVVKQSLNAVSEKTALAIQSVTWDPDQIMMYLIASSADTAPEPTTKISRKRGRK